MSRRDAGSLTMSAASLWIGAMARTFLALLSVHMMVSAATGKPPRLTQCREVLKAKDGTEVYPVTTSSSCQNITFPCGNTPVLFADTRNCENYYRCTLMTLEQCPCPVGETFNVQTQSCDSAASACDCTPPTTTAPTTTPAPTSLPTTTATTRGRSSPGLDYSVLSSFLSTSRRPVVTEIKDVVEVVDGGLGNGAGGSTTVQGAHSAPGESGQDAAVVISAIVGGCVLVVLLVGIFAFLHIRGYLGNRTLQKPSQPPGVPCAPAGTADRHVYAEIDESMVNGQTLWSSHHVGQVPPPPPVPPPPAHLPVYPPPSFHSLQFSPFAGTGSVKRAFPMTNPRLRCYDRAQVPAPPHWDCIQPPQLQQFGDAASDCSQCSGCSSNQASMDATSDTDMRTPLNAEGRRGKTAYVSKQVYI